MREMESVMEVNGRLTEENLQLRARLEEASDRLVRVGFVVVILLRCNMVVVFTLLLLRAGVV